MTQIEYTYTVLRYRHDPSSGEVLNIGVALYSPQSGQVGLAFDRRYSRLSEAFAGFEGEHYKRVMERFRICLEELAVQFSGNLFQLESREAFADIGAVVRSVWPDQGLSYQAGEVYSGGAQDLDEELEDLFERFVTSQYAREERRQRRDDHAVWDEFKKVLSPRGITKILEPVKLGENEVEFQYAFKNEKWHVLEPISLDYFDPAGISERAYKTVGEAYALRNDEEFGTFYALLGRPRDEASLGRYAKALKLMSEMPVNHRIVEDIDAHGFADALTAELSAHGLLPRFGEAGTED